MADVASLLEGVDDLGDISSEAREGFQVLLDRISRESGRISGFSKVGAQREMLFQRALEAIAKNKFDEAQAILVAALKVFPKDTELLNHLGLVAWEKGEMESAVSIYEKAMSVGFPKEGRVDWYAAEHKSFLRAMEGYALALYQLEKFEDALPMFDALADMNSAEYGGCRYMAGELRHFQKDIVGAVSDYEKVQAEPAVLYNLSLGYFELGKIDNAISTALRAFTSNQFIAERLIGATINTEKETFGFLDSDLYAIEFLEACSSLWHQAGVVFLKECFEHPLVQAHINTCKTRISTSDSSLNTQDWHRAFGGKENIQSLVQQVMQKITI